MDNNSCCILCGFFPVYKHKSSIPFIMRRHCNSEGHKKRLLVNQVKDYPIIQIAENEKKRIETKKIEKKKLDEGIKKVNKEFIIHFKI